MYQDFINKFGEHSAEVVILTFIMIAVLMSAVMRMKRIWKEESAK